MWPRSRPRLHAVASENPPLEPVFAFVKSSVWDQAEAVTAEGFAELVETLGENCDEVELPEIFGEGHGWLRKIHAADAAKNLGPVVDKAPDQVSDVLRQLIEEGRTVSAVAYNIASDFREALNGGLERVFERYDAILTPASAGPAPKGLHATGSPVFCALWTYLGLPAVTLPLLDADGMPLGVQLVGPRRDDARLLRTARWLMDHVAALDAD